MSDQASTNNIIQLMKVLYPWRRQILFATIGIAVLSVLVSLLLPNYYSATALFYVASPDQAMPNNIGLEEKEKRFFGNDSDRDRVLAIGNSSELYQEMIKQFNLMEHYDIDSSSAKAMFKVTERFKKNYEIKKNKFDAIELTIEDQNPKQVADMVNHCRFLIEQKALKMIKSKQLEQLKNYEKNIENFESTLEQTSTKLKEIQQKYQIYNSEAQSESFSKLFAETLADKFKLEVAGAGASARMRAQNKSLEQVRSMLDKFSEGYPLFEKYLSEFEESTNQLVKEQQRLKQLKSIYNAEVPIAIIIEDGQTPTVKSRPKRSLIVLFSVFVGFVLSILMVLLIHQYQKIDWDQVTKT